jgi:flagellar biosynthesis protein FliP
MENFSIAESDIYIVFTSFLGFIVVLAGIRSAIDIAKRS